MSGNALIKPDPIQEKIYTIRGVQVMLDSDLAELYGVETRVLNQAVKRNSNRFPADFMFRLTKQEFDKWKVSPGNEILMSQSVISKDRRGGRQKLPNTFTEQGVAMLSAILRSETAVRVSVQIMQAFVSMRKFMSTHAEIFRRLEHVEVKQLKTDEKFEHLFNALAKGNLSPKQGIFYDGQIFDAYVFVADLIKTARKSIILIDNYIDETVLQLLSKRNTKATAIVYCKNITSGLRQDLKKHNQQYATIHLRTFNKAHDRFLILDESTVYHFGASLKDVGKKWFAFSKMNIKALDLISRLEKSAWECK
ncbi:MAG: ORF6N domain-containing protein [Candidatus Marinimicrobia bacterium]|nr:ORF6N domain-containing protein [Candidatus Neomarinimicrobiota bacterium]